MADWDENSAELRQNLRSVLRGIRDAAQQRQPLTLDAIRASQRDTMHGLTVPRKKYIGRFRGEPGLEGIEVGIGKHAGSPSDQVAKEVGDF